MGTPTTASALRRRGYITRPGAPSRPRHDVSTGATSPNGAARVLEGRFFTRARAWGEELHKASGLFGTMQTLWAFWRSVHQTGGGVQKDEGLVNSAQHPSMRWGRLIARTFDMGTEQCAVVVFLKLGVDLQEHVFCR